MKIFCVALVITCLAMVFPFIAAPIDDPSLVLYLPFNEGSGNIANDFSGKGNDGVLKNGTTWVDGIKGKALLFNGVDNYVEVAQYIPIDDRPFTVEAWVYRAKEQKVNSFDMIITQTDDFATDKGFHFAVRSDAENGILAFAFFANDLGSKATIEKEQWYHLVGVYTGKTQQAFINGKLDSERDTTPYKGTKGNTLIGFRVEGIHAPGQFDGIIDEVAIYQKALDEAEIKQDMNSEFIKAAVYPSGKHATVWSDIKIE